MQTGLLCAGTMEPMDERNDPKREGNRLSQEDELTESTQNDSPPGPGSLRRSNSYSNAASGQSLTSSNDQETLMQAYSQGREEIKTEILIKASQRGQVSTVKLILELGRDLSHVRSLDSSVSPLHSASMEGHKDIVDMLLAKKFSPSMEDLNGNTALHFAASNGHLDIVAAILEHETRFNKEVSESQRTNLLHQLNKDDLSPLGCALSAPHYSVARYCLSLSRGNPPDSFADFGKAYLSSYTESILDKPAKIFVLGDRGAGKSTLTKALQESRSVLSKLTFGLAATGRRIRSSEDTHFTGVITTEFYSPNSKRVIFYDLAGHTNYFNKELVDSEADIPHSVFIVLLSLKEGSVKVKKRLVFWLNFLYHHLFHSPLQEDESKPSVIIIGSHYDCRPFEFRRSTDNERLVKVFTDVQEQHPTLVNSFSYLLKPQSLDCRKFQTAEMRYFRNHLYRTCLRVAPTEPLPSCTSYVLSSLLHSKDFAALPALTLGELASKVRTNSSRHTALSFYHLLPEELSDLLAICKELESHQRIVLFSNPQLRGNYPESIWIVHNSYLILTAIDKKLASLNDAYIEEGLSKEFFEDAQEKFLFSLGIVTRETLGRAITEVQFADSTGNFILDINLAMELLQHFKYTELIDSVKSDSPANGAFFFPALLPNEAVEPDNWEGNGFGFALSIRAARNGNVLTCFLPRFLKKLLLHFTQQFILPMAPKLRQEKDEGTSQSSDSEVSAMWSSGLSWQVGGIRVHIVTSDSAIILSMYSEPDQEIRCISLRNEIICTIREERFKWQEAIETEIFVMPFKDKMLPVENFEACHDHWIPLKDVYVSLLEGKTYYKGTSFTSLLYFEPAVSLLKMPPSTLDFLSDPRNCRAVLREGDLLEIYESFGSERGIIVSHFHFPALGTESSASSSVIDLKRVGSYKISDSEASISIHTATSLDSEPTTTSTPTEELAEITCEKFLSFMASLSVLDFMGFLNDIKDIPNREIIPVQDSTPPPDPRHGDSDDIEVDLSRPSFNKSPVSDRLHSTSPNQLPLVGKPELFDFTNTGDTFRLKDHNVSIVVPSGAVTKTAEIQSGVLLTGPFKFPSNTTQVSPILWLHARTKKTLKFSKNVEVSLPHFIDCSQPSEASNLAFVKATHDSSFSDKPFVFTEVTDQTTFKGNKGSVFIKQCCFLCIIHKVPEKVLEKTNFRLVSTMPKHIETKFELNFYVVHALKTCTEYILQKVTTPDCKYEIQTFKFSCNPKPALKIDFNNHLKSGWKAAKITLCNKIYASDVKLCMSDDEDDDSPSHFTIEVLGTSAIESDVLSVIITGADRELELQKTLAVVPIGRVARAATMSYSSSIGSSTSLGQFTPVKILDKNLTAIIEFADIDHLRPVLMQQGTILPEEHDRLVQQSASLTDSLSRKRISIEALVGMLRGKGYGGVQGFIQALDETSSECLGHRDIMDILKRDIDYEIIMGTENPAPFTPQI